MGNDIQKGTTYAEGGVGGSGTVNAANLNAHVDEARIKASFVSSKSLKDPASMGDAFVVENSGVLYRMTMQQVIDLLNTTVQKLLPVGAIIDFAGANPPDGWLLCFGQAVSRETWSELWAILGTRYGAGNGVDTFNLPDLRGFVVAGVDNMGGTAAGRLTAPWVNNPTSLGGAGGEQAHSLTWQENGAHYHNVNGVDHLHFCTAPDHTHFVPPHQHGLTTTWANSAGTGRGAGTSFSLVTETRYTDAGHGAVQSQGCDRGLSFWSGAADRSLNSNTDAQGNGYSHNNTQPTMVLNKIIRAQS